MEAAALVRERYPATFLTTLLAASFLPAVVSLLDFEVTNGTAYLLIATFSSLAFLGSAHIWLTLAYYTDRRWLAHFNRNPAIFYVAPLVIAFAVVTLCAQPYKPLGIGTFYVLTFMNL
jgi:hypothetical protein